MTTKHLYRALAAASMIALAACGQGNKGAAKSGAVLAEVNGSTITTDQFKNEMKNLPPQLQAMAQTPDGKKELLESMIIRQIVLDDAKKDGIDKSKEVTDRLEDLKQKVVAEIYLKKKLDDQAKISEDEMKKFYEQNKDRLKTGPQVRASHILVKDEKQAQDILAQLKKGASFEDLAKKYSTDATATKGGDLGWFGKDAMVPEFEKAVFGLKEGETSGIVKTKFGYHIIKLTGKRPGGILPYEEVKEQIRMTLLPQKQQELFQKLKTDLRKNAKVKINEAALNSLGASPQGAATPAGK